MGFVEEPGVYQTAHCFWGNSNWMGNSEVSQVGLINKNHIEITTRNIGKSTAADSFHSQ